MNYWQAACNDYGGLARPPRIIERGGADEGLLVCAACSQVVRVDVTGGRR